MTGSPTYPVTRSILNQICTAYGMTVDDNGQPPGQFVVLYIGAGKSFDQLGRLCNDLQGLNHLPEVCLSHVTDPRHPQYGQPTIEIPRFWNE